MRVGLQEAIHAVGSYPSSMNSVTRIAAALYGVIGGS